MRESNVTFGQLDDVLRAFGFEARVDGQKHRLYTHPRTGAIMALPERRRVDAMSTTHRAAAKYVLANYEIADETAFASQLQLAS